MSEGHEPVPDLSDANLAAIETHRLDTSAACLEWVDSWRGPLVAEVRRLRFLLRRSAPLLQDVPGSDPLMNEIVRAVGSDFSW